MVSSGDGHRIITPLLLVTASRCLLTTIYHLVPDQHRSVLRRMVMLIVLMGDIGVNSRLLIILLILSTAIETTISSMWFGLLKSELFAHWLSAVGVFPLAGSAHGEVPIVIQVLQWSKLILFDDHDAGRLLVVGGCIC